MIAAKRRGPLADAIQLVEEAERYVRGLNEELLVEWTADFAELTAANLVAHMTTLTAQSGGASGVYRVRIGGSAGAADGAIVATMATVNASFPSTPDPGVGSSFSNPGGRQLVKITANATLAGQVARLRATHLVFEPA